jgi:exodeoxyribonuclease VII small subunit
MPKFEDQLTALEQVVERLERGELSLDESVRLFEEGVNLSNACKRELEQAEGRIQVLLESPAGGGLEASPLPPMHVPGGNADEEDEPDF